MSQTKTSEPLIDWGPAPGFILISKLNREDVAALYNRGGGSKLDLPDNVGKVSDSAGIGKVIKTSGPSAAELLDVIKIGHEHEDPAVKKFIEGQYANTTLFATLKPSDYVAFMPYTDLIIEIDGMKYGLIEYKNVRAVRKA